MLNYKGLNQKLKWKVGLLFSAILPMFIILNNGQFTNREGYIHFLMAWVVVFAFLFTSWMVNMYIIQFFFHPSSKVQVIKKIASIVVGNSLVLGIFIFLGVFVLDDFYMVFERKPNAVLFISIRGITSIVLIHIVLAAINSYTSAQEVAMQNQVLKTENIRAQFELLRQQVNPHFLFNSLSTLRAMIRSGNPDSELFVIKLAEMYRNLLAKRENETSTLSEELDFVNNYSFMLFARFKDMLQIQIDVDESLMNHALPTFCLQLLVENCIKHNIISSDKPLTIQIFTTSNQRVCVQNQIHPKFTSDAPSGFGISNLKKRFEMLGVTNGIKVVQNESMFKVEVKLIGTQIMHAT